MSRQTKFEKKDVMYARVLRRFVEVVSMVKQKQLKFVESSKRNPLRAMAPESEEPSVPP
jgi:hypothetical protein